MKKFILSVLCAAVFFIGLGGLIQETGARFKSDERALNLVKQARTAIGGEDAINGVKSMTITAKTLKTFDIDGAARVEQGDLEINLGLPNQFSKMLKFNREDAAAGIKTEKTVKQFIVVTKDGENPTFRQLDPNAKTPGVFKLKRGDGETMVLRSDGTEGDITKIIADKNVNFVRGAAFHENEMFRTTLALLMTAPQGIDVAYTLVGEGDVDGNACDIIEAKNGNSIVKIFLDKASHLPRMISYQSFKPMILKVTDKMKADVETDAKVFVNKFEKPEMVEFQVRFSDYRSVNGVLLPHQWTQTIAGNADETVSVSSYEINPANIEERFQKNNPPVLIRSEKKAQ